MKISTTNATLYFYTKVNITILQVLISSGCVFSAPCLWFWFMKTWNCTRYCNVRHIKTNVCVVDHEILKNTVFYLQKRYYLAVSLKVNKDYENRITQIQLANGTSHIWIICLNLKYFTKKFNVLCFKGFEFQTRTGPSPICSSNYIMPKFEQQLKLVYIFLCLSLFYYHVMRRDS